MILLPEFICFQIGIQIIIAFLTSNQILEIKWNLFDRRWSYSSCSMDAQQTESYNK